MADVCPRCRGVSRPIDGRPLTQVEVDGAQLDVVANFCYLGDMLSAGVDLSWPSSPDAVPHGESSRNCCQS